MTTDVAPQHRSATSALRWVAAALSASQLVAPPIITSVYGDFLSARATNDAATAVLVLGTAAVVRRLVVTSGATSASPAAT
jgi:hypothetical protein